MSAKIILTDNQKSQIIRLYKENPSIEQIKRVMGLDRRLILPVLKHEGILRNYLSLNLSDIPEAIRLYNSGLNANEIAEK